MPIVQWKCRIKIKYIWARKTNNKQYIKVGGTFILIFLFNFVLYPPKDLFALKTNTMYHYPWYIIPGGFQTGYNFSSVYPFFIVSCMMYMAGLHTCFITCNVFLASQLKLMASYIISTRTLWKSALHISASDTEHVSSLKVCIYPDYFLKLLFDTRYIFLPLFSLIFELNISCCSCSLTCV